MKINFTKKEYRNLLDLLVIADWVINSHRVGVDNETEKYNVLTQRLYSYAKDMGCSELLILDKSTGKYYPNKALEEESEVREFIECFEEDTFWQELIARLATRDLLKKYGENAFSELDVEQRISATCDAENEWEEEFNQYGLKRVGVK